MKNYLVIDYSYLPARGKIYKKGVLVNQWSINEPKKLVDELIDSTDLGGFDKIKIKKTLETVMSVFEPARLKVVDKTKQKGEI